MLYNIYNETLKYLDTINKKERKHIGQFFTQPSIAIFMSKLMTTNKNSIRILDAGAGSGILTSALCQRILESNVIRNIDVVLYENNENILPLLQESINTINEIMEINNKTFSYKIIKKNFILDNAAYWNEEEVKKDEDLFDIIISNPPYKKIRKNDVEAVAMKSIVYGQPNIYFLFIAMAAKLLKKDGELIFINPRSFTSGAYFKKFRNWFLNIMQITDIHLFNNRGNVFKSDKVLQETLIFKSKKTTKEIENVTITTSNDDIFNTINKFTINKKILIDDTTDNSFILIPTNKEELDIVNLVNSWRYTLPKLGFKISTGKVVDFRSTKYLSNKQTDTTVPLIWPCNFNSNKIIHPIKNEKSHQYIESNLNSNNLIVDNKDYVLVKRFSSKEETKRIQCALYFKEDFNYNSIGVENHLNYIYKVDGEFTREELYGLFTILNSSYIDKYYRILNGSTQVNVSEVNSISLPSLKEIKSIGLLSMQQSIITVEFCDNIIEKFFINKNRYFENVM